MPRPTQALLKQHDRKYTDLKTLVEQRRLLSGTVISYQANIEKNYKNYCDWCERHDLEPEKITLSKRDVIL